MSEKYCSECWSTEIFVHVLELRSGSIEYIEDAPILMESRATIKDGYLNGPIDRFLLESTVSTVRWNPRWTSAARDCVDHGNSP
jgi:hypothetical protein